MSRTVENTAVAVAAFGLIVMAACTLLVWVLFLVTGGLE